LGESSFSWFKSLKSMTLESGSRLERIEKSAFWWGGSEPIETPGGAAVIDGFGFAELSMGFISVSQDGKQFRLRECFLEDFGGSPLPGRQWPAVSDASDRGILR
jgi:hypothetical protein